MLCRNCLVEINYIRKTFHISESVQRIALCICQHQHAGRHSSSQLFRPTLGGNLQYVLKSLDSFFICSISLYHLFKIVRYKSHSCSEIILFNTWSISWYNIILWPLLRNVNIKCSCHSLFHENIHCRSFSN